MIDSTCDDSGSEDSGCDGVTVLELSEEVLGVLLVLLSFLVQAVKETTVARTTAINNNFLKIFSPFNTIYPLWKNKSFFDRYIPKPMHIYYVGLSSIYSSKKRTLPPNQVTMSAFI